MLETTWIFEALLPRLPIGLLHASGTLNRRKFRGCRRGTAMLTDVRFRRDAEGFHVRVKVRRRNGGYGAYAVDWARARVRRYQLYPFCRRPFGKLLRRFHLKPAASRL